jgi:hypothetical protein
MTFWHWNPHLLSTLWDIGGGFWIGTVLPYTKAWPWKQRIVGCLIIFCIWPLLFVIWAIATYQEHLEEKYPVE